MIKAVVIDDEHGGREVVVELITTTFPDIEISGQADSVESGFNLINKADPDLVFLDIKMPDGSGFDLLKKLKKRNFEVVFITAFDSYAIKAFEYSAVYYLLKPIQREEFSKSVSLARQQIELKKENSRLEFLVDTMETKKHVQNKIVLPTLSGFDVISISEIIRCESEVNYTRFYLSDKRSVLVSRTLKEFENILSENGFFRVHRSHIINLNHISKYIRGKGGEVIMSDGSTVDVSREKKEEFLNLLSGF